MKAYITSIDNLYIIEPAGVIRHSMRAVMLYCRQQGLTPVHII